MPDSTAMLFRRAVGQFQAGEWREVERLCLTILSGQPAHADALHLLGLALSRQDRHDDAIRAVGQALELQPTNAVLMNNAGEAYRLAGRLDEAATHFQQAICLAPSFPEAHFHLGNVQKTLDRPNDAIASYRQAVQLRPGYAEAHYNLANTLREEGRVKASVEEYERALAARPNWADAHLNLANALLDLDGHDGAIAHYEAAGRADPRRDLGRSLASAYVAMGEVDQAKACYRRSLERHPEQWLHELRLGTLCEPIPPSNAFIDEHQARLAEVLVRYRELRRSVDLTDLHSSGAEPPMALAYQGRDVLPLMRSFAELFAGVLPEPSPCPRPSGDAPRVGVVVTKGHEGVFARCVGGIVERLGSPELQVSIVCSQSGRNVLGQMLRKRDLHYVVLPARVDEAAERIRAERFSLLHYWEIGTDSTNYFLPFFQPAPLQTVTWGWPVTSGNPRVDAYVSCARIEADDADAHYSEKLKRLEALPTYYYPPPVPEQLRDRDHFGLPADEHVYLCVQNVRKYHPDFDTVLADILRADGRGRLFLIGDVRPTITELLLARFRSTMPDVIDRVHVLPRMDRQEYLNVLALADVLLDTPHYGGGANTGYDAAAVGVPVVALPGPFHRGRWTAAIYRQLDVADAIAASPDEYVQIAVKLATDADWRQDLRSRVTDAAETLFEDGQAVCELREYLLEIVHHGFCVSL